MTARIFAKLLLAVLGVLAVALATADYLVSRVAENDYRETLRLDLLEKARLLAASHSRGFSDVNRAEWQEMDRAAGGRFTLVARSGQVLADSEADAGTMENHSGRPEIQAALAGRDGFAARRSPTTGIEYLYVAVPVSEGALRLAVPMPEIREHVNAIRGQMLVATLVAFLPALALAGLLARYVSSRMGEIIGYAGRLAAGDFRARLEWKGKSELGILSGKLNETARELEELVRELAEERSEMERLDRVRRDFVINVSHELRTPLASIQGYAETLLDGALKDEENNVRFVNIIRQNAERLGRLIADLMTISRLELKTQRFQPAAYEVNSLLKECIDSMIPMAEKKRILLSLEPAPEEAGVFCDAEAVHQILGNLIDNAVKYTPEGGSIVVGGRVLEERDGHPQEVEITVRDTGIGIPAEDQPRLFERFYRVDKARSRELGGTGLGLAIVKHLVRAQGGEVGVRSELNRGSTFYFTLPVRDLGIEEHREVSNG